AGLVRSAFVKWLQTLLHPVIDKLDAAADNHLLLKYPVPVPLEERTGRDTRLREHTADPALPRLGFQRRQKRPSHPARLVIGVDVEVVEMPIAFQVSEPHNFASDFRDKAEPTC